MTSLSDKEILELHDLLDALIENNLPKHRLVRLENWISDNEEVRQYYIEFMDMSSSLRHYAEELISDDTDGADEEPSANIVSFWKPLFAIAALVVFGIFFNHEIQNFSFSTDAPTLVNNKEEDSTAPTETPQVIVDTVAVLTKSVGVRWEDSTQFRADLGDTLEPSTLKLANGLVQVEFLQGATVVLEGPVEFSLKNPNEGTLVRGKLRAIVPQVATGFTVVVPKG